MTIMHKLYITSLSYYGVWPVVLLKACGIYGVY